MEFVVNNGRTLKVFQARDDGPVYVITKGIHGEEENSEIIRAGDFITMLNWCRYQKENGNINLYFE